MGGAYLTGLATRVFSYYQVGFEPASKQNRLYSVKEAQLESFPVQGSSGFGTNRWFLFSFFPQVVSSESELNTVTSE